MVQGQLTPGSVQNKTSGLCFDDFILKKLTEIVP